MGKELVRRKMIDVKRMTPEHVSAVAALERISFPDPWSERSIASEVDNPLSLWLVALFDGELVGYVGSQTVLDEADMMNLAVSPNSRRLGIAKRLVSALTDALRDRGVRSLSLEVRVSNEPARRLYESQGFCQVGRRPNYYRNPKEDALILRKEWPL